MFMAPIVETEIIQIISKFKQNKSAGHDDIGNLIIKKVAKEIALPLTIIFNESFSAGFVPENLRIAKVIPIYKKDDAEEFSNYFHVFQRYLNDWYSIGVSNVSILPTF